MNEDIITRIFCEVDDFCNALEAYLKSRPLPTDTGKAWFPCGRMALSEVIAITLLFQLSGYRCLKLFYKQAVQGAQLERYFPRTVSYNRFVELMRHSLMPLALYTRGFRLGSGTGVAFIDSTPLKVCHNRRICSHRVFSGLAGRGKTSTGWFYGFKLHLVINDHGEILSFFLTAGNVDDRNADVIDGLCGELTGKLFGDRGYISKELFERLYGQGLQLVTRLKKNMKNVLMDIGDKLMMRKRAVIESVNNLLKNKCQVEHTRHRSVVNFLVNLLAAVAAHGFLSRKPSIHRGTSSPVPVG